MLHFGSTLWGSQSGDMLSSFGRSKDSESISFDYRDISPFANNSKIWGQRLWNLVNYLAFWNDRGSEDSNENRSNKESPVDPPEDSKITISIRYLHHVSEPSYSGGGRNGLRIQYGNKKIIVNQADSLDAILSNREKIKRQDDSIRKSHSRL